MAVTEDELRDAVARFILDNAADTEYLFEPIGDLFYDSPGYSDDDEDVIEAVIEHAYKLHRSAKVTVEIDGWEYEG